MFIAKYDALGNVLWAKSGGGVNNDFGYEIAVDASGNSYVIGVFEGSATFGSYTLVTSGLNEMYIAKYDVLGNVIWAKKGGGTNYDMGYGIAVDAWGNSYATGVFQGSATFGNITLTSSGRYDVFIAKYDVLGNVLWAKRGGGTWEEAAFGIAVDAIGNSYITGSFQVSATFGSISVTTSGWNNDMFIVKYDTLGNELWVMSGGGADADKGDGISVDAIGNSYVTGYFIGNVTFGNFTLTSSGGPDIFIVKYDASGNVLWAKNSGGVNNDLGRSIDVDALGNSYVTGTFQGSATFGGTTLISSGGYDVFVAKYDALGNVLWAKKGGGTDIDDGFGIALDTLGNCYVTGYFGGSTNFGSNSFTSSGGTDMFITKLSLVVSGLKEEEAGKANIQVYPNPVTSTFSITLPEQPNESLLIRMTDVLGREVYRQTLPTDAAGVVSVSPSKALSAGLYQLQVRTAKATFIKKTGGGVNGSFLRRCWCFHQQLIHLLL